MRIPLIAIRGKPESKLVHSYTYHGSLKVDAAFALNVSRYYTTSLIFPFCGTGIMSAPN